MIGLWTRSDQGSLPEAWLRTAIWMKGLLRSKRNEKKTVRLLQPKLNTTIAKGFQIQGREKNNCEALTAQIEDNHCKGFKFFRQIF